MWQCEQFLLTGEFKCSVKDCDYYDLMRRIKPMTIEEIHDLVPEVIAAMSDMNIRISMAESKSDFINMKPDLDWIEKVIVRAYEQEK